MTRDDLLFALQHPNVVAFLRVIREGESSQGDSAYSVRFGGSHFEGWEFPDGAITIGRLTSTASGAYQFLHKTWAALVAQYGFPDFSPQCQDEGAVALIAGRKALQLVMEGRIREAIARCALEWASLPGSPYGQRTRTLEQAITTYIEHGGTLAETAEAPERKEMIPVLIPILAELAKDLIPQLGSLFGSGSDVQQRNVAAATVLADTIVKATGAVNLQDAADKIQSDPGARDAARAAVADAWPSVVESGGGGIKGARDLAISPDGDWRKAFLNPAFVIGMVMLGLVCFVVVVVVLGLGTQEWSDEIKAMVITAVVSGALGSVSGFFLGSSLGSQKKDAALAAAGK